MTGPDSLACFDFTVQMQDNKAFLGMMNNVLNTDGFYFATDYDLTHTLQRLANTSPEFQEMSLLERVRLEGGFLVKGGGAVWEGVTGVEKREGGLGLCDLDS